MFCIKIHVGGLYIIYSWYFSTDLLRVGWRGRFSSDKIYTCYLVQLVSFCGIFNFTRCIVQKLGLAVINLRGLLFSWNLYWVTLLSFWFYDLEVSISDLLFRWGKPSFWSVFNISLDWWDFSAFFPVPIVLVDSLSGLLRYKSALLCSCCIVIVVY